MPSIQLFKSLSQPKPRHGDASNTNSVRQDDNGQKTSENLLEGLAALPYHTRISHFVRGSTRHWVTGEVTVVDFRPLYTVAIHDLQRQLTQEIQKTQTQDLTDSRLELIRDTLHKYTNALRDFEFIHANRWQTQFVKDIAASRLDNGPGSPLQAALISEMELPVSASHRSLYSDSDVLGSFDPTLMQHSTAVGRSLGQNLDQERASEMRRRQVRSMAQRFISAILGGLIIVVPMLILVLGIYPLNDIAPRALAVISTSIFLFAIAVALFSHMEPANLLAATAAYAAVLVTLMGQIVLVLPKQFLRRAIPRR